VVDLVPGAHPLRELETALLGVSVDPPPSLLEELELDELGLTRAVNRLLPDPDAELLIVIDQLEELFTLVDSDAERAHVLESIRVATADPTSRIRVVATLRADFYDQPLSVRGFGDLLAARNEAITPMSPEELERAIVGPAERVGLDVEPGLVAAMVADVIDRPGALPLLQYALTELADREDIGALTLSAYRKIGGVSGALARRAEHLYDALDEAERVACRQLFLRLVTLGEGTEDTRRRVRRSDLLPIVDRRAIDGVIETYGRHRLISFDREPGSREPTVEIAHEALLAAWARLHGWIDEARDDLRSLNRLAASAGEWMSSGRDPSFLLGGSRLEQTAEWAASTTISMSAADRAFLDESVRQREHDRAGEAERVARERGLERRSVRRLRGLVAVFAAAALVAASLTVVARNQGDRAEDALRVASARELAGAAVANLEADPERSLLLALAAVETTRAIDGTVLREAEEALHRAIGASRVVTRLNVEAADVEFSPDGARLATTGNPDEVFGSAESKTERHAFVWDTETGDREVVLSGHREGVWEVHFSPDGSRLATASEDGTAAIWDGDTGERMFVLRGHAHGQLLASFSADGSKLLTTDLAGAVRLWDARTGKLEREFSNSGICGGGLSPDGSLVAGEACEELGTGLVVDAHTGERILKLKGHTSPLLDMAFSPDGSLIATGSVDGSARIWAAGTGRKLLTLEGHGGWVFGVDFDPAGEVVATAGEDGTARLWDATSGRELLVLSGHTGIIRDVDFSPDGRRLATSSGDGTVRVWDVGPQGSREQATLAGPDVTPSVAYSPDGRWIATASYDGRARLWNAATGRRIVTFSGGDASSDVALAPDGKTLATAGFSVSGTPILWDTASGKIQRILGGPKGWTGSVAFSPDGTRIATGLGGTDEGSGQVLLWEMATGRLIDSFGELKPGDHPIVDLAFSRDGKLLAAASFDGTARVWILASGEESLTLRPHAIVVGVAFNPDGQLLATSGTDGTVKIWNVSTGAEVRSLAGHLGTVARVAFSPDGKLLASAGFDNTARLWDVSTGRQLLVLTGHTLGLTDLAFSPDGTRLATSANDGTVRVYVLPIEELIELARSRLTRSWTEDECRQYLHLSACPTT
jgi:WD40 repeat protein